MHPLNTTPRRTHGGISPTKGIERGEGGARVGVRVLRLDLSLSTTSFSICSWPGSNVRQDGTFSWDWDKGENIYKTAQKRETGWGMQVFKKMNIYIYNRVEETFPQLPWFQVRCLEKTRALLHLAEGVNFNVCVCVELHYCEFGLSILHAQDESGCLQVSVPAAVVLQGHKPTQVQLLHIL